MAIATLPPPSGTNETTKAPKLWFASFMGGIYILSSLWTILTITPFIWENLLQQTITSILGSFFNEALQLFAQAIVTGVAIYVGNKLAGPNPIEGLRGGIFVSISVIVTVFFLSRALAMIIGGGIIGSIETVGLVIFVGSMIGFGFYAYRFLTGKRAERWSLAIEHGGWLSFKMFKKTQGIRVRRFTLIGFLIIGCSGIYTLVFNQHLSGVDKWEIEVPFLPFLAKSDPNSTSKIDASSTESTSTKNSIVVDLDKNNQAEIGGLKTKEEHKKSSTITLLLDVEFSGPLILFMLVLWISWRAVNFPMFADFLIATESEMNKVSWVSRKALIRDTIVVLSTTFILTMFLLFVDVFWGWFLSRDLISVIPKTTYKYTLTLDEVDPDKKEEILKVLTDKDIGIELPSEEAKSRVDLAPSTKFDRKHQPQKIKEDLKEEDAEKYLQKLTEAGAKASLTRGKSNTINNRW